MWYDHSDGLSDDDRVSAGWTAAGTELLNEDSDDSGEDLLW